MSTPPPLPGRVFDAGLIPDGSNTYIDLATGEIKTHGPSQVRARRLAARAAQHERAEEERREQARQAAASGAQACRDALPKRTAIGLERQHNCLDLPSEDLAKVGDRPQARAQNRQPDLNDAGQTFGVQPRCPRCGRLWPCLCGMSRRVTL